MTSPDTATVRPATSGDAHALADLSADSFGPGNGGWSLAQLEGSLALATTRGWVVKDGDALAGFILCQHAPPETEILTLAVHPRHRRRGLGTRLLRALLDAVRDDSSTLFLDVAADNAAAIGLYRSLGFHETGRRRHYYRREGTSVDALLYRLDLTTLSPG